MTQPLFLDRILRHRGINFNANTPRDDKVEKIQHSDIGIDVNVQLKRRRRSRKQGNVAR
ncbi:MAG: hypothetical protein ACKPKO_22145 [Candidatus Fonsibacter sp.]